MRVCIVSQEYPPGYVGGIGTQSRVKALGLAKLGHDVELLTAGHEDGAPLVSRDDGPLRVHELRTPDGVYNTETYWLGYTWAVLRSLRALAAENAYDVVDFPDYGAEGFAFQLDRQQDDSTAVAVHLHGSTMMFAERIGWPEPGAPLHRVGTFMEGVSIEAADRVLAASRSIAEFTASHTAVPLEQIDVVEGAVDTDRFTPSATPRPDGVMVLFVGNIVENKGVHTVFEAFLADGVREKGISLHIAGSGDDEMLARMQARAQQAGLADRFVVHGFVEHERLPDLYRAADILAAPSQYEGGLGMVYLEAMACGVPVIATAAGGAAEAVADGETGILLDRGDVAETAAAISALAGDPGRRRRMGDAARRRAESRFSVDSYAERVAASYERAIRRRRSAVVAW